MTQVDTRVPRQTMPDRGRLGRPALLGVVAAVAVTALAGVLIVPRLARHDAPVAVNAPGGAPAGDHSAADLATAIAKARDRLSKLPGDWLTWAQLGSAYVEQARITCDPTPYPRAQDALEHSLRVHPTGNAPALTGLGALAAARHDFAGALHYGQSAVAADAYSAPARGVVADALVELGRYDEAWDAIQAMLDLLPDSGSYARASYSFELRGDLSRARDLMNQSLAVAPDPADEAFALLHLAELAWQTGDLAIARSEVDDGLRRAPGYPQLVAERAKLEADRGERAAAIRDYQDVLNRLPMPQYATEFGDLLTATGDRAGADQQYALVTAAAQIYAAQGVDEDLDIATFQADHGQPAAALAAARTGYAKRPSTTGADVLGWALHRAGQDAEALGYAKQSLALGTHSALYRYHLGMIEYALGQREPARADLTEALRLNPTFSLLQAPVARETLDALGGAR